MDINDYLREQAITFRGLAVEADDVSLREELLDLAAVCEEVAANFEDRMTGG